MNKYASHEIKQLIEEIARTTKEDLILTGFRTMEMKIGKSIGEKFLYKKYQQIMKNPDGEVSMQRSRLDDMLGFLGFDDLDSFNTAMANPISDILKSCEGIWLSYVRQNSNKGIVYQSPVNIYEKQGKMLFHLKGPHQPYIGRITFNDGTMYILFEGENGKQFHHVYKLGKRIAPNLLQGIFSGVSTVGEPIGGRTALIRSDLEYESLTNKQISIEEFIKSSNRYDVSIGHYFKKYTENNLSIKPVNTFEIDDLG